MPGKRALQRGLDRGEFVPYFQPIFSLRTNQLAGYEILARWQREACALLPPSEFVEAIEHWELSDQLTEHLLRDAFHSVGKTTGARLSVNVSPRQLREHNLPRMIEDVAQQAGFALGRLTVEITENALIDHLESVCNVAEQLRELGVSLALDDFGTGYSSLTHLQSLPLQELKVDQSFVRHMQTKRESRKIVAAVIGLGRSLGLTTVAEGVELEEQAEILHCLGCDLVQGWKYGKPHPAHEVPPATQDPSLQDTSTRSLKSPNCIDVIPFERYAHLRAIYDGAPVGLCFLDHKLRYISLNRRLAEMNGKSIEEHLGKALEEVQPEMYAQAAAHLQRALQGIPQDGVELTKRDLDGGHRSETRLASFEPARDEADEIVGVLVAVVDISDRKRFEQALRESEGRLQAVIDAVPVGIAIAEAPSGRVVRRNPAAQSILGQDPIAFESVADYSRLVNYTLNGARLRAEQFPMARALGLGLSTELEPVFYELGNTGGKWLRISGAPIRDEQTKVVGAVAVIQEIATKL